MELTLNPVRPTRNLQNGQFLKGITPPLKGKTWEEFYSKETIEKQRQRIRETFKRNPKGCCPAAGHNKRKVVGINEGKFFVFESAREAHRITGAPASKITQCCRGSRKTSGGFKWFYENDNRWMKLINNN